ncbi:hypothetical protein [Mucilaginibacter flavidus]|uniref:hypothetical protein n=1 Tax=Mucilaginibacter flavidus TaxID=2949309 RepID=UPI0020926154|nr:hypothetical protein [Mucilaginibacter flavidus]MCO5946507.1 hypothetical protein [Mucilaginibacter flavidus]
MIPALAVILFCVLNSFNFSSQQKFRGINDSLRGHVKTETYFYYESNKTGDAPDSNWNYKRVHNYNKKEQVESIYYYNAQNKVDSEATIIMKYDSKGREISTTNLLRSFSNKTAYSNNKNGNEVQINSSDSDLPDSKWVSDKSAMIDTSFIYRRDGTSTLNYVRRKNKNGDIVEERQFDEAGHVTETENYTYDDHHNKLTEIRIDNNGEKHLHFFEYDKFGNETFERAVNDMYIGGWRVGESDPTNKDIIYYRLKYSEFDKHDNWLKEEALFKGKAVKKLMRKIEYYD